MTDAWLKSWRMAVWRKWRNRRLLRLRVKRWEARNRQLRLARHRVYCKRYRDKKKGIA